MTTEKQIEANQQNCLLGGVKTEEGKKTSRMNALKYGFFSRIVTDYDKIQEEAFCKDIYECFAPSTAYEEQLVEVLLSNILAYRRICLVENEHIKKQLKPSIIEDTLPTYDFKVVRQKGYSPVIESGVVDELEKFQRYKTAAMNLVLKTQHELERLQRMRKGENVPSPAVCDINITATTE